MSSKHNPEQVAALILEHCQPYLKAAKGHQIFRGMDFPEYDFVTVEVDKDRQPWDTAIQIHNSLDAAFTNLGYKARRGNSIFASREFHQASDYGRPHVIFPLGKFHFTWSEVISDLFLHRHRLAGLTDEEFEVFIRQNYQHDDDLVAAINSWNEIMITCDTYYAVAYRFYVEEVDSAILRLLGSNEAYGKLRISDEKWRRIHKRVGLVPYFFDENGQLWMKFMSPSDENYGGLEPQIAKGVIREKEGEEEAAKREASEELGLKEENISGEILRACGHPLFNVFAAHIKDPRDFAEPHFETGETYWMTPEEFGERGRPLHKDIVEEVVREIRRQHS